MTSSRASPWRLAALTLLALLRAGPARALDPHKSITQYALQVWKTDNGLPQNSIQSILQTRDGYLWLGTEQGLVRFDGVQFTIFDKGNPDGPGMLNSNAQILFEDTAGNFWVGTRGGLHLFKDGRFAAFTKEDGLPDNNVIAICEDPDGSLWIGTAAGLAHWKDGRIVRAFTTRDGLTNDHIWNLRMDSEGTLWIGTNGGGLNRFRNGKFSVAGPAEGYPAEADYVLALCLDRRGDLWVGSDGSGLLRYRDGRFTRYTQKDGLASDSVESIVEDRDGNLWIGSEGEGLTRLSAGTFSVFKPADGLSDDTVQSLYEDGEGSLWIGTVVGGLDRLKDGKFTTYSRREGLSSDRIRTIYEDRAGAMWLGTRGGGVNRFLEGRFTAYTAKEGLSGNFVQTVYEDGAGKLWIGTWGLGLNRMDGSRFRVFRKKDGFPSDVVRCLYRDRAGTLWIGTDDAGLVREQDGKFTAFGVRDGLPVSTVLAILEGRDGNLWIGTEGGGLNRFADGKFTPLGRADGLASSTVRSLYQDADGCLWIGTDGDGLVRLKNGKFARITEKEGLFEDVQYAILEDVHGNFWMSCSRGIYRVPRKELEGVADGRRKSVTSVSFGRADGMRSVECSGLSQPAAWKARDGKLWFPTIDGAVVIDPDHLQANQRPPPVVIEQVRINHRVVPPGEGIEIPPGDGDLEFRYTGLSFVDPERVYFRYMLEGFDRDWVNAGARRAAYYTNIPPGRYRFRVLACNNDGVWNATGDSVAFRLRPHFLQTPWVYGLGAAAFVLAGFGAARVRAARARARERALANTAAAHAQELENTVAERTLQLEEANTKLQQLSEVDSLTGIANRRRFEKTLEREWRRAGRDALSLSLVMIDIDFFKDFNDAYGHQVGDQCLRRVASEIRAALTRPADLVARYGGEEFAAILPSTPAAGALAVAELLRKRVEEIATRHSGAPLGVVTISLGVATATPWVGSSAELLVAAADAALYRAKRAGKNRVEADIRAVPAA